MLQHLIDDHAVNRLVGKWQAFTITYESRIPLQGDIAEEKTHRRRKCPLITPVCGTATDDENRRRRAQPGQAWGKHFYRKVPGERHRKQSSEEVSPPGVLGKLPLVGQCCYVRGREQASRLVQENRTRPDYWKLTLTRLTLKPRGRELRQPPMVDIRTADVAQLHRRRCRCLTRVNGWRGVRTRRLIDRNGGHTDNTDRQLMRARPTLAPTGTQTPIHLQSPLSHRRAAPQAPLVCASGPRR